MENLNQRVNKLFLLLIVVICLTAFGNFSGAQPMVSLHPVIQQNLTAPIEIVNAGDGSGRLFVVERAGAIKAFSKTHVPLGTFLDLSPVVKVSGEGGLLSIAFHPDYEKPGDPNEGDLFVFYTDKKEPFSDLVVDKYKVTNPAGNIAIVAPRVEVIRIPHPNQNNHYGGEMHFGPDGMLYLSLGDGGSSGDPNNNAQRTGPAAEGDLSYLLGKMLRIDVDNPATGLNYSVPTGNFFGNEIFDYGLRNPFRWSFDRATGDMWIGDVGQNNFEEIDFRAAATGSGVNYGWNCFEGAATYPGTSPNCGTLTNYEPAYAYDGQSVIGGVVYRGAQYADLKGYYVGTDVYSGNFHLIKRNEENTAWVTTVQAPPAEGSNPAPASTVVDIGESENGEIYAVSLRGSVYHLEATGPTLPVALIQFEGLRMQETTKLFWETSSEEHFKEFEVQFSEDARSFRKVGAVSSENPLNGAKYQFVHAQALSGNAYYRLKMIDTDLSFQYSRTIALKDIKSHAGDFVRPSLINTGIMNLEIGRGYQTLEIVGINGSIIQRQDISGKTGALNLRVSGASSGLYLVRLIAQDHVTQQKVMILQ